MTFVSAKFVIRFPYSVNIFNNTHTKTSL